MYRRDNKALTHEKDDKNKKFNDNGWCFGVFLIILHIKWA